MLNSKNTPAKNEEMDVSITRYFVSPNRRGVRHVVQRRLSDCYPRPRYFLWGFRSTGGVVGVALLRSGGRRNLRKLESPLRIEEGNSIKVLVWIFTCFYTRGAIRIHFFISYFYTWNDSLCLVFVICQKRSLRTNILCTQT